MNFPCFHNSKFPRLSREFTRKMRNPVFPGLAQVSPVLKPASPVLKPLPINPSFSREFCSFPQLSRLSREFPGFSQFPVSPAFPGISGENKSPSSPNFPGISQDPISPSFPSFLRISREFLLTFSMQLNPSFSRVFCSFPRLLNFWESWDLIPEKSREFPGVAPAFLHGLAAAHCPGGTGAAWGQLVALSKKLFSYIL